LLPGKIVPVFDLNKGGRITGLSLSSDLFFQQMDNSIHLRIYWDNETIPAIDCPLTDFFGFAFGKPAMHGWLIGTNNDQHLMYCYIPMPFDKKARIELASTGDNGKITIPFEVTVFYLMEKRKPAVEGKLYVERKQDFPAEHEKQLLLSAQGRGHYIGTILVAKGSGGGTFFFEGDDSTAVDGEFRIHGTGTEDYFNGGWYSIKGRWDTIRSQPLTGCLGYPREDNGGRTGGYRFYLSDKISFEKSIYEAIEHGASEKETYPALYTTLAFYYCDRPKNLQ